MLSHPATRNIRKAGSTLRKRTGVMRPSVAKRRMIRKSGRKVL